MSAPYPDMLPFYLHSATSTGAGGGDEDPHRNPYQLKSSHEADVPGDQNPYREEETETDQSAQAKKIKRNYPADPGPFGPCPVCQRSFKSSKALHGHMRCHPDRAWRGMVPPEQCDPHVRGAKMGTGSASGGEASGSGAIEWPFRCRDCGANFRTKQALGGHRASHKSKKGCYMLAREGLANLLRGANINNNNNNNNINNNNNAGMRNNGGGGNGRDGAAQGSRIVDLNLPPPEEEDEEEDA